MTECQSVADRGEESRRPGRVRRRHAARREGRAGEGRPFPGVHEAERNTAQEGFPGRPVGGLEALTAAVQADGDGQCTGCRGHVRGFLVRGSTLAIGEPEQEGHWSLAGGPDGLTRCRYGGRSAR
ncbi:hypothetical protein GCM10010503_19320 [Streptomyces lucensis JCM 4490]|uniref:Uncharacterized protein n=1 Tax=Streptomyces lucensis JCM 4490 TaxID=1306176 RepID=A0A918MPU9_9ACTN|nr:hypothetical protein GCM10010503_19320 [Streptomyces lucensis JCM 4490]